MAEKFRMLKQKGTDHLYDASEALALRADMDPVEMTAKEIKEHNQAVEARKVKAAETRSREERDKELARIKGAPKPYTAEDNDSPNPAHQMRPVPSVKEIDTLGVEDLVRMAAAKNIRVPKSKKPEVLRAAIKAALGLDSAPPDLDQAPGQAPEEPS